MSATVCCWIRVCELLIQMIWLVVGLAEYGRDTDDGVGEIILVYWVAEVYSVAF